jgi:hypothetical protein
MKTMTQAQFKKRWESNDDGGGITFDDIAECAKAWGLCGRPRIKPIDKVTNMVLTAAGVEPDPPRKTTKKELLDLLGKLRDSVTAAIESGDWDVDGRNDPEEILEQIAEILPTQESELALPA